jgi:hypothetical protein
MAEEKKAQRNISEKEVFQHLAEIGRIQSKWTSTRARSFRSTCSGFGQFHRVMVELSWDYRTVVKLFISSKQNDDFL